MEDIKASLPERQHEIQQVVALEINDMLAAAKEAGTAEVKP